MSITFFIRFNTFPLFLTYYLFLFRLMVAGLTQDTLFLLGKKKKKLKLVIISVFAVEAQSD